MDYCCANQNEFVRSTDYRASDSVSSAKSPVRIHAVALADGKAESAAVCGYPYSRHGQDDLNTDMDWMTQAHRT